MSDLIERMRSLEQDHAPDGWPAVQMRDISALCDLVEAAGGQSVQPAVGPEVTDEMIEAGAQRLVAWEDGSVWPDSWSPMVVAAARNDAERVLRSALNVRTDHIADDSKMVVNLKQIAKSKIRQMGGDVCGVLVRKGDKVATVTDMGRVKWLSNSVLWPIANECTSEREAFEDAMAGEAHLKWIPEVGEYSSQITQKMWQTWRCARAGEDPDLQLIEQRDYWEEKATELAEAVGEHFGFQVGEHSSANCPVQNAIDQLDELGGARAQSGQGAEPVARHHATVCYEDCLCEHGSGCKLEAECGVHPQPAHQESVPDLESESLQAIANKVCGELPEGWVINLCMENGAAWVEAIKPSGYTIDIDRADLTMAEQVIEALKQAAGAEQ